MTSEPDKTGRRPPTIELKATEVENPSAAAASGAADTGAGAAPDRAQAEPLDQGLPPPGGAAAAKPANRPRSMRLAFGAIAAIVILAAIAGALWYGDILPWPATRPVSEAAQPAPTPSPAADSNAALAARLDQIEQRLKAQPPATAPALTNRLNATEAQTKSLTAAIAALNRRVDALAQAADGAAKQAAAAADAAKAAAQNAGTGAAASEVQKSDLDALAGRIAALEGTVKTLAESAAHRSTGDQAARLTIAAEALRAAVERGAPYQDELAAVQALGADANAVAPLEPFAAQGLPGAAALAQELAALLPSLAPADTTSSDASFLGRLEAHAQKLVRITSANAPVGTNPGSVIDRLQGDAARADIAGAIGDLAALPDSAKAQAADWIKRAKAREAALAASRHIAADALAALAKPASQ